MEYQVRAARITDVERIVALRGEAVDPRFAQPALSAADLLRQLVNLPQASVVVAESGRELVGSAVLALRPSVRAGGYVGTIDLLIVGPDHDPERVTAALVDELLRSARNKGCTVVEAAWPADPGLSSSWERLGFSASGPRIERTIGATSTAPSRFS